MSALEYVKQALRDVLNNNTPALFMDKECVTIFQDFFARFSATEVLRFLPPHLHPNDGPQQPRDISSTHDASHIGRCHEHSRHDEQPTTLIPRSFERYGIQSLNPHCCEPTADILQRQTHPGQPNTINVPTPKSSQEQQDLRPGLPVQDSRVLAATTIASLASPLFCEPTANILTPESFHQQNPSKNASKLINCIKEVAGRELRDPHFYECLWDDSNNYQDRSHTTDPYHRYANAQILVSHCSETEVKHIFRQRIGHLLGAHELQVIEESIPASELPPRTKRHTFAVTKLARSLGKTNEEIAQYNTKSRHYLTFFYEIGPGAILLLGEASNKKLLEKTLGQDDVECVLKTVKSVRSLHNWILKCEEIHFVVASLILKGLQKLGWDGKSYYNTRIMSRLADFIDLDAFREFGLFQQIPNKNMPGTKRKRGSDCPRTKKQFRGPQSDPAHRSPSHAGLFSQAQRNFRHPASTPNLIDPTGSEPALFNDSEQTVMSTDTDATTIVSPKSPALIPSATASDESLAQHSTPDEITTPILNNPEVDWEKFDNGVSFAQTPENLDHGWEQSPQSTEPQENFDHAWEQFVRSSENLDHGWKQYARDLGFDVDAS
ncbi:uncharacterized protein BDV14DRAFT_206435 [Aspergillus stella-maris]|uniref:uncharacterized protein n=1 Tax=Aspergillus stella-maris TaxID=1810926 RepID=UPI003CCE0FFB